MIEKTTVEGRPAMVAYLNDRFEMVQPDVATVIKVVFTDERGGMMFGTAVQPTDETTRPG